MATVPLNPSNIEWMAMRAEEIIRARQTVPVYPDATPAGVGDEAYALLLPPSIEQDLEALMPSWSVLKKDAIFIGVHTSGARATRWQRLRNVGVRQLYAPFTKPHLALPGRGSIRNVPGIEEAIWDGIGLTIKPATDGSVIQSQPLREWVDTAIALEKAYDANEAEAQKARTDMAEFLRGHRTLEKAIAAFGPSLLEYATPRIKALHEAPTVPRKKRTPKVAPVAVDTDYLAAAAMATRLNLN